MCNCSAGLRTCCADHKKNIGWEAKIPSAKLIWNKFLRVTMKVLNSLRFFNVDIVSQDMRDSKGSLVYKIIKIFETMRNFAARGKYIGMGEAC